MCLCLQDKNQSTCKTKEHNPTSLYIRLALFYLLPFILCAQREVRIKYLWYKSWCQVKKQQKSKSIHQRFVVVLPISIILMIQTRECKAMFILQYPGFTENSEV